MLLLFPLGRETNLKALFLIEYGGGGIECLL